MDEIQRLCEGLSAVVRRRFSGCAKEISGCAKEIQRLCEGDSEAVRRRSAAVGRVNSGCGEAFPGKKLDSLAVRRRFSICSTEIQLLEEDSAVVERNSAVVEKRFNGCEEGILRLWGRAFRGCKQKFSGCYEGDSVTVRGNSAARRRFSG